jgi:hypothetical protein
MTTTNEKLLESYRDVFKYLDSKLMNPMNFSYTEQHLINLCQQIKFFIQTNPCLQKFLVDLPQLNALASSATMINKGNMDEVRCKLTFDRVVFSNDKNKNNTHTPNRDYARSLFDFLFQNKNTDVNIHILLCIIIDVNK